MKIAASILFALSLAAPAMAGDRAPQLPPIDAGTILNQINNQHNPFPQPVPSTLDYCVFTEFKNNKCLFKCESGAILVEPAVKPDFSTGEPAGACATMIIRTIKPPFLTKAAAAAADEAKARPVQNWADAAKAAYDKAQDEGGLTDYADLKELPPGARSRLEQELKSLPQGPGNSSEAFKMMANGRTAFVVQSYIYSDSLRVYIFNAAGVPVAYGEGSADTQFAWLPLPSARVAVAEQTFKSYGKYLTAEKANAALTWAVNGLKFAKAEVTAQALVVNGPSDYDFTITFRAAGQLAIEPGPTFSSEQDAYERMFDMADRIEGGGSVVAIHEVIAYGPSEFAYILGFFK